MSLRALYSSFKMVGIWPEIEHSAVVIGFNKNDFASKKMLICGIGYVTGVGTDGNPMLIGSNNAVTKASNAVVGSFKRFYKHISDKLPVLVNFVEHGVERNKSVRRKISEHRS